MDRENLAARHHEFTVRFEMLQRRMLILVAVILPVAINVSAQKLPGLKSDPGPIQRDVWLMRTDSSGQVLWSKTYGYSQDCELGGVIRTRAGGFALAGTNRGCNMLTARLDTVYCRAVDADTSGVIAGKGGCWLVVTDSAGNEMWDRCYLPDSTAQLSYCKGLVQLDDGRYVMAGSSIGGDAKVFLQCVSESGEPLWSRTYSVCSVSERARRDVMVTGWSMIRTHSGDFVMAGVTQYWSTPNHQGHSEGWLLAIDDKGEQKWLKTFTGSQWEVLQGIAEASNGDLLAVGSRNSTGLVVRLSPDGDVIEQRNFEWEKGLNFRWITPEAEDKFLIGGLFDPSGFSGSMLLEISAKGDSLNAQVVQGAPDRDRISYAGGSPGTWGSYIVVGTVLNSTSKSCDGYIVNMDAAWQPRWVWSYGYENWDDFSRVLVIPGGYLFAGRAGLPHSDSSFVVTPR